MRSYNIIDKWIIYISQIHHNNSNKSKIKVAAHTESIMDNDSQPARVRSTAKFGNKAKKAPLMAETLRMITVYDVK